MLESVEFWVLRLDHIGSLLTNHVDRVLRSAIRDDGDDGSINNAEVLDTMDLERGINDTLFDALG